MLGMDNKQSKYSVERLDILRDYNFPLSAKYDMEWLLDNAMGSQCLWLTEGLSREMQLKPGMRVLDLGCGMVSSDYEKQIISISLRVTDKCSKLLF